MEHNFLHVFQLRIDGLPEPVEFRMFLEREDVAEATDAFAQYVARQEDNFLPLGTDAAGSCGVVSCLWIPSLPLSSLSRAKSVNVPPMSTPMR